MAKVKLENVTKIFDGQVKAVDAMTLDVADGQFMVILGPSGCGKTTTLRLIAGLEEPTNGNISIGNTLVNDIPPNKRDVAMVFQNYALYPHMTVFQNLAFGLMSRNYSKTEISQQVKNTAKLLGIDSLLHRKPKALSGGQQQRVALGRAIVKKPKVFLFDEPLSNLDARRRLKTRTELKSLHQRLRTTIIYVTHDQAEAMTLGQRICVMDKGVIQQVAPPMEVYQNPVNRFVAGFLGTPPMNFFDGRIDFKQDTPIFVMNDTELELPKRLKENLTAWQDRQVVLGVRPEHFSLAPIDGQKANTITATVDVIEPLGDHILAYLKCNTDKSFVANLGPHIRIKTNDPVVMHINTDQVHIFEPGEMGKNIIPIPQKSSVPVPTSREDS